MRQLVKRLKCEVERIKRRKDLDKDLGHEWNTQHDWEKLVMLEALEEVVEKFEKIEEHVKDGINYRGFDWPTVDSYGRAEFKAFINIEMRKSLNVLETALTHPVREEIKKELEENILDCIFDANYVDPDCDNWW